MRKQPSHPGDGRIQANQTSKRRQARENECDQVAIGFSFASDGLKGWREFSRPIKERREAKPMQSRITFDTQMKIGLIYLLRLKIKQ